MSPETDPDSISVVVGPQDFELGFEIDQLRQRGSDIGAIASFTGLVRGTEPQAKPVAKAGGSTSAGADDTSGHRKLQALEVEHYPAMTTRAIEKICRQAQARWDFQACRVIHRTGPLSVGEQIVLVLVVSTHRQAAFDACEFIMDYLKTEAPFWKKAIFEDCEQWVEAKASDASALEKWHRRE